MRTFSVKDDCTLSGRRLHREERRVEGGGYVDPAGGPLLPGHGVVVRAEGMKKGEKEVLAAPPPRAINVAARSAPLYAVDKCKHVITCKLFGWLGVAIPTRRLRMRSLMLRVSAGASFRSAAMPGAASTAHRPTATAA